MNKPVKLSQQHLWQKKEFVLEEDCLVVKTADLKELWEYKVRYEQLGFEIERKAERTDWRKLITPICGIAASVYITAYAIVTHSIRQNIICSILGLSFFGYKIYVMWRNRKKEYLVLKGGQKQLTLFGNIPDAEQVSAFVASLHKKMREKYKQQILNERELYPLTVFIDQLNWLISVNAITEQQKLNILDQAHSFHKN